jgi:hypothetical protein
MFKKTPIIKYESSLEEYPNSILPSKKFIPDWYKKIPQWKDGFFLNNGKQLQKTVKQCMPFFDSLTIGYMITLPNDIYVKLDNGIPYIIWSDTVGGQSPRARDEAAELKIVPTGHYEREFIWNFHASFTIPRGYSTILTHPLNRHDLPFTTFTGIIDGGLITDPNGSVPFYIKSGFEGLIPQGTPIAQLIPFRQENWKLEKKPGLVKLGRINANKAFLVFNGFYKKTFWVRKNYE